MDTGYLNKLMDERSWLESILPHVNNDQARKEVEKKIKELHDKVEKEKVVKRGQVNMFFEFLARDNAMMDRFWDAYEKWKEEKRADSNKG